MNYYPAECWFSIERQINIFIIQEKQNEKWNYWIKQTRSKYNIKVQDELNFLIYVCFLELSLQSILNCFDRY